MMNCGFRIVGATINVGVDSFKVFIIKFYMDKDCKVFLVCKGGVKGMDVVDVM